MRQFSKAQPRTRLRWRVLACLGALALAVSGLLANGGAVTAQGGPGNASWSIQPSNATGTETRPNLTYDLARGSTVVDYVGVQNLGEQPLSLRVYASDAFTTPEGGFDLLPAGQQPRDVGSWIDLDARVDLAPRQRVLLPFSLRVPQDATPGDHAGGIVASRTADASDAAGNAVKIDLRVGTRVYLRVNGPLRPDLVVEDFGIRFEPQALFGRGMLQASYTVRNRGNVRLRAAQQATVSGPLGIPVRQQVLDELPELLPGAAHTTTVALDRMPPLFWLATRLEVSPAVVGNDGVVVPQALASGSVWAVPWAPLAALIPLGGLTWLGARMQRRSARQRKERALFAPEVIEAVKRHMNQDHPEESLAICQGLGDRPTASSALMTGMDAVGIEFAVVEAGAQSVVRVPWSEPVTERAQIRAEVVRMYQEACARLGIAPVEREGTGDH
ncbi:MAG: DUF2470 domain-containing protein [Dehalococcoidia bacterium]|nr:DUF2470 domain-containing protein [Dehalococcoidia bacterium]